MATDLSGNIQRFEAGDLRMFAYQDTVSIPSCVAFNIYDVNGNLLVPSGVESGVTVTVSGGDITKGNFYIFRQLPSSRGFYTTEWMVYGSGTIQSSMYTRQREVIEIYKTEPVSIYSYGNKNTVMRVSRQLVGRGDLTEADIAPHMLAAYDFINAKLGTSVPVPFNPATNYIAQGEEILAIYTLHGTYGAREKGEIPPAFNKLRDDFLAYMDAVIAGEITVDGTLINTGRISQFTGGIEGGLPTFGRRAFEFQRIDWNVLEEEWGNDSWWDCPR